MCLGKKPTLEFTLLTKIIISPNSFNPILYYVVVTEQSMTIYALSHLIFITTYKPSTLKLDFTYIEQRLSELKKIGQNQRITMWRAGIKTHSCVCPEPTFLILNC
jgi:hypothetical protein